jgi:hypothetical protein
MWRGGEIVRELAAFPAKAGARGFNRNAVV